MGNLFRWVALASLLALGATMANTTYAQGSKHIDLDDDAPQTATDPPPQNPDADNDNALPVSYAKRPLTLPALILRGDVNLPLLYIGDSRGGTVAYGIGFGGGIGVTDDIQIDAALLPIAIEPTEAYGNPEVSATFRFKEGKVEIGARAGVSIPVAESRLFRFSSSLLVLGRLTDAVRLDTGLQLTTVVPLGNSVSGTDPASELTSTTETYVGAFDVRTLPLEVQAGIPMNFSFNVIDPLRIGTRVGVGIRDLSSMNTFFMPAGMLLGMTLRRRGNTFVDFNMTFDFPFLLTQGLGLHPEIWMIGFTGHFYFDEL